MNNNIFYINIILLKILNFIIYFREEIFLEIRISIGYGVQEKSEFQLRGGGLKKIQLPELPQNKFSYPSSFFSKKF